MAQIQVEKASEYGLAAKLSLFDYRDGQITAKVCFPSLTNNSSVIYEDRLWARCRLSLRLASMTALLDDDAFPRLK